MPDNSFNSSIGGVGGTDLLSLAERRMKWLQKRESVLAGNVANANTPGYVSKDISPFQGVVEGQLDPELAKTSPMHMSDDGGSTRSQHIPGSSSLDGNHVVLEDELGKIADTNDQQRFATTVYGRYMSMYSTALGSSSQ
ncbi:flagellar basal-body rod protein FlgB [Acetobacter pasteurianus NBRC 3280]|uniref:Flagellar basal-body rod protein FlgB n=1 Tax=Acetobacter pasteurianus NBRC 3278 TaxID=1226660 RepID=A0A401X887_ACEPA|nr:flagellar basal body protein [Acetobacter pasteurianus]GCD60443.1 flagellar basal-body rod protein FlgB [Acetobacter pasteurianus NBRC 3277]GCD64016.1 flagellar basal-body rod protein FlgB [Acetobacter pasteurianus NBRC 3278]GCD70429.1 flagellar basal-body rod protein FlgB [Acetobacter pasteurianus NBRC 3280]